MAEENNGRYYGNNVNNNRVLEFGHPESTEANLVDFMLFENIDCIDYKGRIFDHYDKVYVSRSIFPNENPNKLKSLNSLYKLKSLNSLSELYKMWGGQ